MRRRAAFTFTLLTALGVGLVAAVPAAAAGFDPATAACVDVEGFWARGSGEVTGDREWQAFQYEMRQRVGSSNSLGLHELGADVGAYPAIGVSKGWDLVHGAGATIWGGEGAAYGRSVDTGAAAAAIYLDARHRACPGTQFVLGGYSQGAQVMGQLLDEGAVSSSLRKHIAFSMLFGDPKLNLPEGKKVDGVTPACAGRDLSSWRRFIGDCTLSSGYLRARDPYLPKASASTTGLWCNTHDGICGTGNIFNDNDGHGFYAGTDAIQSSDDAGSRYWNRSYVAQGVREAAARLQLVDAKFAGVNASYRNLAGGSKGTDVVFVIDSTGSMAGRIDAAKQVARTMSEKVVDELGGKVGLVEYRDAGDAFVSATRVPLTRDLGALGAGLDAIGADGGGDTPEALLAALMTGLNEMEWDDGATKAAVVLTDAGYHDPDVATGVTIDDVTKRALEIDPVNVYPVVPSELADVYAPLADATSGKVVVDDGATTDALISAVTQIQDRPVPVLPITAYSGSPGSTFTFDASQSYSPSSTITDFAFDFDGDGVFDVSGPRAVVDHVYPGAFDGTMQVRVTDAAGARQTASATVHVGAPIPDATDPAPMSVTASDPEGTGTVDLTWAAPDTSGTWAVAVDGVPAGRFTGGVRATTLTGVDRSADVQLSVAPVSVSGDLGDAAVTTLAAFVAIPVPVETTPPPTPGPGRGGSGPVVDPTTSPVVDARVVGASRAGSTDRLAWTGADLTTAAASAAALLAVGFAALLLRRSRRRRQ